MNHRILTIVLVLGVWFSLAAYSGVACASDSATTRPSAEVAELLAKARAGDVVSMVEMGRLYANGRGVERDCSLALAWFSKAAAAGNSDAMYEMGSLYFNGSGISRGPGVPQDYTEAMKWFRKSAEKGNAAGMYGVGIVYEGGLDVTQNDEQGRKWIGLSAQAGFRPARDWLAEHGASATADGGGIGWATFTGLDHQIFPSLIVSTSRDDRPLFAHYLFVKVTGRVVGAKYHIEAKCDSLMEDVAEDGIVPRDGVIPLKISWNMDALGKIRERTPVDFTYSLEINGRNIGVKTDSVDVHSINDCVFHFRDVDGKDQPYFRGFAAYVNEESPKLDKLLQDSLAAGVVRAFDGYQENDPKQVVLQVYAIWHALQERGVKYSSIAELPTPTDEVVQAQHVRFVDESIDDAQANCVDGSIVFASVLKKIGIDSALALTPEHCFVVFFAGPGEQEPVPLETTLLGAASFDDDPAGARADLGKRTWESRASHKTFEAALQAGADELNKLVGDLKDQAANPTDQFVGVILPISSARKMGVEPIPTEYATDGDAGER
jgi:Sel1 repeat